MDALIGLARCEQGIVERCRRSRCAVRRDARLDSGWVGFAEGNARQSATTRKADKGLRMKTSLLALALVAAGCGGTGGGSGGGSPKRSYSLGSTVFSAWSGGSGSGDPDPKQVTRGDCTSSFLATGVNFPGSISVPTAARLSLICNQLLPSQIRSISSNSTIIGYGTEPMTASACPSGLPVGKHHGWNQSRNGSLNVLPARHRADLLAPRGLVKQVARPSA
jgi:hypothetical protein